MLEQPRSSPPIASCSIRSRTEEQPCWLGRGTPPQSGRILWWEFNVFDHLVGCCQLICHFFGSPRKYGLFRALFGQNAFQSVNIARKTTDLSWRVVVGTVKIRSVSCHGEMRNLVLSHTHTHIHTASGRHSDTSLKKRATGGSRVTSWLVRTTTTSALFRSDPVVSSTGVRWSVRSFGRQLRYD